MTDVPINAILYVKRGCPFCLKASSARIAVSCSFPSANSRTSDLIEQLRFQEENANRPAFVWRVSFRLRCDARLGSGIDTADLPTFRAYADGIMPRMMALHREIGELKNRLS